MNEHEELQQNNMISNLPLLFANGYPTSLEKMTELQLEKFIPFMVQCSLGHINLQGKVECSEPEWWPESLHFSIPITKPKKYNGSWIEKLKEVVLICYQFHKSVFLLRFCNDLSLYEHASLRFINNYNSTTSLFDRRCNKLLVTFRNENMSYDQPQRQRKCLLQQKSKTGRPNNIVDQMMVEPAPFDIYLCDNCDAELYSPEAMLEHEKACKLEDDDDNNDDNDDDVILCDTPEPAINLNINQFVEQSAACCSNSENNEMRERFLLNFNLQCRPTNSNKTQQMARVKSNDILVSHMGGSQQHSSLGQQAEAKVICMETKRRITRRSRTVHSMARCSSIPLSSPAGQLLLRNTKSFITSEYLSERLDRIERFCYAPLLSKTSTKPKYLDRRLTTCTPHCSFKKPVEYSSHLYVFPRRQFSQRRRSEGFRLINSSLLKRCRPISVRLKKMSDNKIKSNHLSSSRLNIKLTRDNSSGSKWKISSAPSSSEIIVDTIDLCTSEDEDDVRHYVNTKLQNDTLKCYNTTLQIESALNLKEIRVGKDKAETIPTSIEDKSMTNNFNYSQSENNINATTKPNSSSNSNSESPCKQLNSVKSLFSSVYILSNYVTNPLTAIVSDSTSNETPKNVCNQTTNAKLINDANTISPSSSVWFSTVDNDHTYSTNNTNNNTNNNNNKLNGKAAAPIIVLNTEYKSHNIPTIHPNRIISIDLTS